MIYLVCSISSFEVLIQSKFVLKPFIFATILLRENYKLMNMISRSRKAKYIFLANKFRLNFETRKLIRLVHRPAVGFKV